MARFKIYLAANFPLIMPDVIAEVLSSLFTGKAIKELFTRKMGKSLALLGRLPEQLNVLSAIFCDKLGE
jgi:hypothetical protein